MGHYTQLVLNVDLNRNTPPHIIEMLNFMIGEPDYIMVIAELFTHPLFATQRWQYMLNCDSTYFHGFTRSELRQDWGRWMLGVRTNFKNYDKEIEHFIDWLHPHIEAYGFCGYIKDEGLEVPTLLYSNRKHMKNIDENVKLPENIAYLDDIYNFGV